MYSIIAIIYNPNSTGDSRGKATTLARELRTALPKLKVRLQATKRVGHGEFIAYRTALLARHALIISVSGDGGYNEVINGAMRAQQLRKRVTVGLVPAGNANDHYASVHRGNIVDRIVASDEDRIDILRLTTTNGRRVTRYGHSYIGIGLTPQAGEKLNQKTLNLWQEIKIVTSVLLHPKSVKVLIDGEVMHYDSLVFSNVGRMSKVIRMPRYGSSSDGVFEVSHVYNRNKIKLMHQLAQATLFGLETEMRREPFSFETLRPLSIQIDGEITRVGAGADVVITLLPSALPTIV
jgi:diacylglycerol kinase (ATP)